MASFVRRQKKLDQTTSQYLNDMFCLPRSQRLWFMVPRCQTRMSLRFTAPNIYLDKVTFLMHVPTSFYMDSSMEEAG